ncbi:hypothetical protein HYALB_00010155 [Hymenoscyphus albidus]|uniref:Uncharacterized protein n=1 Tax=Hymenoscyphus albidus TaxID=595503 RepID=A0A9N9M052_9HELO|nr:hypothetical protein HYALB_00010155 [Hymenoscyphus albidus]
MADVRGQTSNNSKVWVQYSIKNYVLKKIYITKNGMTAVFTRGHRLDGRDGNQAAKSGAATLQAFWRQELWGKGKGTLIVGKIEIEVKTNPRPADLNHDEYDTEEPCHGMHLNCEILPSNTTKTQPLTCDYPHMLMTPVERRAFVLHDLTNVWKYLGTFCSPLYIKLSPSQILIAFPKTRTTTRTRPFTDRKLHFKEINGVKSSYVTDTYVEETTEYGYGDEQLKLSREHLFKAVDESLVEGGMPVEFFAGVG